MNVSIYRERDYISFYTEYGKARGVVHSIFTSTSGERSLYVRISNKLRCHDIAGTYRITEMCYNETTGRSYILHLFRETEIQAHEPAQGT